MLITGHKYKSKKIAKIIIMTALFSLFSSVNAEEEESLSSISQPIKGDKPEYVSGEIKPTLNNGTPLENDNELSQDSTFNDLKLQIENPQAIDIDEDQDPQLKIIGVDETNQPVKPVEETQSTPAPQTKPLIEWFLVSTAEDSTEVTSPIVLADEQTNSRFSDVVPGKQIELRINAALMPFTLTGFQREGEAVAQIKTYRFNVPARSPGVMSDGLFSPLDVPFPTIGFENAAFYFITPMLAPEYNWNAEPADLVEIDSTGPTAIIKLKKQPDIKDGELTSIAITATDKNNETDIYSHTFILNRWLVYGQPLLEGGNMPVGFERAQQACLALGENYGIPPSDFLVSAFNDGTNASRSLTGNLWNEWGSVDKIVTPPWSLAGLSGQAGFYWTTGTTAEGYRVGAHLGNGTSLNVLPDTQLNFACAVMLDGSQLDRPKVKNLKLSGELRLGYTPVVSYEFDDGTGETAQALNELENEGSEEGVVDIDESSFAWGLKNKTTKGTGAAKTIVLTPEQGILLQGKAKEFKEQGLTSITEISMPALTKNEVGQVLEFSIRPENKDGIIGPVQTIATDMPFVNGNQTFTKQISIQETLLPFYINGTTPEEEIQNTFPTTGFKGAQFKVQLSKGLTNEHFYWDVTKGSEIASIDEFGVITLNEMPEDENQEIVINAINKDTVYLTYLPTYDGQVAYQPIEFEYTFSLKQWYETNSKNQTLTRLETEQFCRDLNARYEVDNFAVPSFKYQLLDVSKVDNNKNTPFILNNNKLLNEWGNITAYPNSQFGEPFYWVAEIGPINNRKLNRRIGWDNANQQMTGDRNDQLGDVSSGTQAICGRNLDGTPFYGIPNIEKLVLEGAIAEGSILSLSYQFNPNNESGVVVSPSNFTTIDFSTFAASYTGQDSFALVMLTNDRVITLTPLSTVFDVETNQYRSEFTLSNLPASSLENVISVSVRPIRSDDIAGSVITVDTTMSKEEGNLTYRGFSSIDTPLNKVNPDVFRIRGLEDARNFPTTAFEDAVFRLNVNKNDESQNQNYDWYTKLGSADIDTAPSAENYISVEQDGVNAGVLKFITPPPFNERIYVIAKSKTNELDTRLYSFKVKKWFDPTLSDLNAFHSVQTMENKAEFPIIQPILDEENIGQEDYSNTFPTTGFSGAQFILNIGPDSKFNDQYTWTISESEYPVNEQIATIDTKGIVTLVNEPAESRVITITATPIDDTDPSKKPIEYRFKLLKWFNPFVGDTGFDSIETIKNKTIFRAYQPRPKAIDDLSSIFPKTGLTGAMFRLNVEGPGGLGNDKYNWRSTEPELASVGNGSVGDTEESAGNVTLLGEPEVATEIKIIATPKDSSDESLKELTYRFQVTKWFDGNLPLQPMFYSAETFKTNAEHPIIQPPKGSNNYSNTFPTTGFKGAIFRLNINAPGGAINSEYNWTTSEDDKEFPLIKVGNSGEVNTTEEGSGNVMLLRDPNVATPVTVYATPKVNPDGKLRRLSYTFMITKWFNQDLKPKGWYSAETVLTGYEHPVIQPKPGETDPNYDKTFPTTGFKGAIFRLNIGGPQGLQNQDYIWTTSEDGLEEPTVKVGNTGITNTPDGAGNVTLLRDPETAKVITITATPKQGVDVYNPVLKYRFKLTKWFNPELRHKWHSAEAFLNDKVHPIVYPTDGSGDFNQVFPTTGFTGAIFRLNVNEVGGRYNDEYIWSSSHPEIAYVGNNGTIGRDKENSGNITLLTKPEQNTVITITAKPDPEKTSQTRTLTYQFRLNKWFEPNLKNINAFHSAETMLNNSEFPIIQPAADSESPGNEDYSNTFPTTGFLGAQFRLNIGLKAIFNDQYTWAISESEYPVTEQLATIDNLGVVTIVKEPETNRVITITATPIDTEEGAKTVLTYRFKIQKWFNPFVGETGFDSIETIKNKAPFRAYQPRPLSYDNFSNIFPTTGLPGAMFRLNVEGPGGLGNDKYTWRSTEPSLVKVGTDAVGDTEEGAGNVTLLDDPSEATEVQIIATPKDSSDESLKELTYRFKVAKWFDGNLPLQPLFYSAETFKTNAEHPIIQPINGSEDYSKTFPTTGFKGAIFRLNLGGPQGAFNTEYSWSTSEDENESPLIKVGNSDEVNATEEGAGNVTLLRDPSVATPVTVYATPKVNPDGKRKRLAYTFMITKWFNQDLQPKGWYSAETVLTGHEHPVIQPKPGEANPNYDKTFPTTGFKGAIFRLNIGGPQGLQNQDYIWTTSEDSLEEPTVKVGNTGITNTPDGAGNITLLRDPETARVITITATPKQGVDVYNPVLKYRFKLTKWFNPELRHKWHSAEAFLNDKVHPIVYPTDGSGDFNQVFPTTGFTGAIFRLNVNEVGGRYNDEYIWSSSHPEIAYVGNDGTIGRDKENAGNITLLTKPEPNTIITITAKPNPEKTSQTRTLTYQFRLNKWFEPNLKNINAFHSAETMLNNSEFPIIQPAADSESPGNEDYSNTFPTTGFLGAQFRLNIGLKAIFNDQYTWAISESEYPVTEQLATIDNLGVVTIVKEPETNRVITITATPIDTEEGAKTVLTYRFKIQKWFNPFVGETGFDSIETVKNKAPFRAYQPRPLSNDDFSNIFPTTGLPGAMFRLNVEGPGGLGNDKYTWRSTEPSLVKVGTDAVGDTEEGAGNVTLLDDPSEATEVQIIATPKDSSDESLKELTYRFKVAKWFDGNLPIQPLFYSAETFKTNAEHPIIQPINGSEDYSKTFPTTGFKGAIFRLNLGGPQGAFNTEYSWSTSEDENESPLIKVGNSDEVNATEEGAGNVTLLRDPSVATPVTVYATPKVNPDGKRKRLAYTFMITKWFNQDLQPKGWYSAETVLTGHEHPVIQPKPGEANPNYDKTFPTTGFKGAIFRLNIGGPQGLQNQDYIWTTSEDSLEEPTVKVGNTGITNTPDGAGNITLLRDPETAKVITITATPKQGVDVYNPVLKYRFKLTKWFNQDLQPKGWYSAETVLTGYEHPVIQPKPGETDPNYDKTFPTTGFKGAIFRLNIGGPQGLQNQDYIWTTSEDGLSEPTVKVGNAGITNTPDGAGNVTLLRDPETAKVITITATPKQGVDVYNPVLKYRFKLTKWFNPDLRFNWHSAEAFLNDKVHPIVYPTDGSGDFNQVFPTTGFTGAIFRLNVNEVGGRYNDEYIWSSSHPELAYVGNNGTIGRDKENSGNITLLTKPEPNTVITITAKPDPEKTAQTKTLTYQFRLNKWFEPNLMNTNAFHTVETMENNNEFAIIQPEIDETNIGNEDYSNTFPTTGFLGARFRLNIGLKAVYNNQYNWTISESEYPDSEQIATVDASGVVTLINEPETNRVITVTATPIDSQNGMRTVLTYRFKLQKWFNPFAGQSGFSSVETYLTNNKFTPIQPAKGNTDYSRTFPTTGFKDATFKLNIGDTGEFNNEYTWTSSQPDAVYVGSDGTNGTAKDNSGVVTFIDKPEFNTVVTITATPDPDKTESTEVLTYRFKLKKWLDPSLGFIHTIHSIETMENNQEFTVVQPPEGSDDYSKTFPTTGFEGAKFRINIGTNAQFNANYTWTISESEEAVPAAEVNDLGVVTLISEPESARVITVTATPKDESFGQPMTYSFKLLKWFNPYIGQTGFDSVDAFKAGKQFRPLKPTANNPDAYSSIFPSTGFEGATFRLSIGQNGVDNNKYQWSSSNDELVSVGSNGEIGTDADDSGIITLIKEPLEAEVITITAKPIEGLATDDKELTYQFKVTKWFNPNLPEVYTWHNVTTPLNPVEFAIEQPAEGSDDFSKTFPTTAFKGAQFKLNIGLNGRYNSNYNWTITANGEAVDKNILTLDQTGTVIFNDKPEKNTIFEITATPQLETLGEPLKYRFKLQKWYDPFIGETGFTSVDAFKANKTFKPVKPLSSSPDDYSQVFPSTGFEGATFRLSIGTNGVNNDKYNWVSSNPDLVTVGSNGEIGLDADDSGIVTLIKEPLEAEIITITAQPIEGIAPDDKELTYRFKVIKWFNPNLPEVYTWHNVTTPLNPVEFSIEQPAEGSDDFSKTFPTTAFKGAQFKLNIGLNGKYNSVYNWTITANGEAVDKNILTLDQTGTVIFNDKPEKDTIFEITATPQLETLGEPLKYRFKLQKWYDPFIGETGFTSVDAFKANKTFKPVKPLSSSPDDYSQVFPSTGFEGATFRLSIGTNGVNNDKYNWISSNPDLVTVGSNGEIGLDADDSGIVTLIKEPLEAEIITITAQPIEGIAPDDKELTYRFKVIKWFNPNLPEVYTWHNVTTPLNPEEFSIEQPAEGSDDFSKTFPTTAFKGAEFKLNIGLNGKYNSVYNWTITANGEAVDKNILTVDQTGTVIFNDRPEKNTIFEITATPQLETLGEPLKYRFKLQKWFDPFVGETGFTSVDAFKTNKTFKPMKPLSSTPDDYSQVFPSTGFKGATFRLSIGTNGVNNDKYNWISSHPDLVTVGSNGEIGLDADDSGIVTLIKDPLEAEIITITAQPIEGVAPDDKELTYRFKVVKWFNPELPEVYTWHTITTPLNPEEFPIVQPAEGSEDFSKTFPTTAFKGAEFKLNIGLNGKYNSVYDWELTANGEPVDKKIISLDKTGTVIFKSRPEKNTIFEITATPQLETLGEPLKYRFKLLKWFDPFIGETGFTSVDAFKTGKTFKPMKPLSSTPDDYSQVFPTTGFEGATFRLSIGTNGIDNNKYDWTSSASDSVYVGSNGINGTDKENSGIVTLLKMPEFDSVITIKATPIEGKTTETEVLEYKFKLQKWFSPNLPELYGWHAVSTPLSPQDFPIVQPPEGSDDFSKTFPTTAFKGAQFKLNIGLNGRYNDLYNWSLTANGEEVDAKLISLDETGTIVFKSKPESNTVFEITATPKEEGLSEPLKYRFKLLKWFDPFLGETGFTSIDAFKTGKTFKPTKPLTSAPDDYSNVFPTTGFEGATFRLSIGTNGVDNNKYDWTSSASDSVYVGSNGINGTGKENSGIVTLLKMPEFDSVITIKATPIEGKTTETDVLEYKFKVQKWFSPNLNQTHALHSVTTTINKEEFGIIQPPEGSDDYRNTFPTTGFAGAGFKVNIGLGGTLNNNYIWSISEDEQSTPAAKVDQSGIVTLINKPDSERVISVIATPKDSSIGEPLVYKFKLQKWFNPFAGETGFTSVDTFKTNKSLPAVQPLPGRPDDYSNVFPTTGFKGATFKLSIGANGVDNNKYEWTSSASDKVYVGSNGINGLDKENSGIITLLDKPDFDSVITIKATPIAGKTNSTEVLEYKFKLQKWFDANLNSAPYFHSITNVISNKEFTALKSKNGTDPELRDYPSISAVGESYKLKIGMTGEYNNRFNWMTSEDNLDDKFISVNDQGVFNILQKPTENREVSIIAIPKPEFESIHKPLTYRFRIDEWN